MRVVEIWRKGGKLSGNSRRRRLMKRRLSKSRRVEKKKKIRDLQGEKDIMRKIK